MSDPRIRDPRREDDSLDAALADFLDAFDDADTSQIHLVTAEDADRVLEQQDARR